MRLNTGWRFGPAGCHTDGRQTVDLPHCVTPLSWRDWDPEAWQGTWSYRRSLRTTPEWEGKRVLLDVEAALTSATVRLNGVELGGRRGGYLPFTVELTDHLRPDDNDLEIEVDARWSGVPPQGAPDGPKSIDYLEPGGLYREVRLRVVPPTCVEDVFALPCDVLDPERRRVAVTVALDSATTGSARVEVALERDGHTIAQARVDADTVPGRTEVTAHLTGLAAVELWDVDRPVLYDVVTTVATRHGTHEHRTRIGFRDARFTDEGFFLNGRRLQLFGLNRHQLYPYTGAAMPARVQRKDAELLRQELNCVMVRCAHYPQSPAFLDACDELGLLVWEEAPGWQYVDPSPRWRNLFVRDVAEMVRRDRNRPSIVIWGVQVNESNAVPGLYEETRAIAAELDGSRPTSGSMTVQSTDGWVQDVFAFDDYSHSETDATLLPPLDDVPYLVAESVGALSGPHFYRRFDPDEVLEKQALLHARVHSIAGGDPRYAGLLGWVAFDYGSLNGWTWRHVKTPGVADGFRIPKPGAAFYQAQVDPSVRPVLSASLAPDAGRWPDRRVVVWSNADQVEAYVDGRLHQTARPERAAFPHIAHPPFFVDLSGTSGTELTLIASVRGRPIAERTWTVDSSGDHLDAAVDDAALSADGSDMTRVVFRAVDRYGSPRRGVPGAVTVRLEGPGEVVGDNPFDLQDAGGAGALWVRTRSREAGTIRLTLTHPTRGETFVETRAYDGGGESA
ncbi:MAG TPA: glycoside hydrolase family 2 TIM barrel-domain containing protein [Actinopolymorphaceae bacterium]